MILRANTVCERYWWWRDKRRKVYVATNGTEVLQTAGLIQHNTQQHRVFSWMVLLASDKPIEIYFQSNPSARRSQDYVISQGTFIVRKKDEMKRSVCTPWERRWPVMNLGTMGGQWSVTTGTCSFMPAERAPRHSLNRRLGGSQIRCGRFGEKRNLPSLPET